MLALLQAAAIILQCEGAARIAVQSTDGGYINSGGQSATTNFTHTWRERVQDRMLVEINGSIVRVRPPQSMEPLVGGRGEEGGWRTLTDVSTDARQVSGQYAYSWINRPTVRIDRVTGDIQISGLSSFSGVCSRVTALQPIF